MVQAKGEMITASVHKRPFGVCVFVCVGVFYLKATASLWKVDRAICPIRQCTHRTTHLKLSRRSQITHTCTGPMREGTNSFKSVCVF